MICNVISLMSHQSNYMNENNLYHFQVAILLVCGVKIVDKACQVDIGYDPTEGSFLCRPARLLPTSGTTARTLHPYEEDGSIGAEATIEDVD